MLGAALVFGIATACQLIAPKLRVPALILLLPAGFIGGQLFPSMNPEKVLGGAFSPIVNLLVALILFHGGMELSYLKLDRRDRRVVHRLVWLGALLTGISGALLAYFIIGLPSNLSALVGAIVIVSGPTVVGPLLNFVQPEQRIRKLLSWEGTLVDPVGALAAVIVFQAVKVTDAPTVAEAVERFLLSMLVGALCGVLGVGLIYIGLKLAGPNLVPGTQVLVGAVIVAAGLADFVADDAGLVAALVMGMTVPFLIPKDIKRVQPFFDTIVAISIGVLFVSISALVTPESIASVLWPTLLVIVILVLVVRPAIALLMTGAADLRFRERLFIGWMAPRGIVAAASAASFAATLVSLKIPEADKVLPVTYLIIAGTVAIYGLTAVPIAEFLGVRARPDDEGTERTPPDQAVADSSATAARSGDSSSSPATGPGDGSPG